MTLEFFTDENLPTRMAWLIDAFDPDCTVYALEEEYGKGVADTVWIPELAKRDPKPAILSGDRRILTREQEKRALREHGLTFVLFAPGWMHIPWKEQAVKVLKVWPEIARKVSRARAPTLFEVPVSSSKIRETGLISNL